MRSDSKVMRLVPKKSFIYSSTTMWSPSKCTLVPAHTFSSGAAILCRIPTAHFVGRRLRPALQPSGCLLLTQNGVLSLLILLFKIKEVARCEIRWVRRLQPHRNAFGCQKLRSTRCCSVRFLGIILAQIFLIPNSSYSIKRTVSRFMFTSLTIILTANLPSDRTSSPTHAVLSPARVADGHPLRCSPSRRILPSENIFCQRKACAFDIASFPKACWSFPCVVVAMSPSLTHKEKMAYRCAMFRASFSWRGSQTPPDMSSTYSTPRHCTAMPLQVRIEEGRRSKPVRVSGLRLLPVQPGEN